MISILNILQEVNADIIKVEIQDIKEKLKMKKELKQTFLKYQDDPKKKSNIRKQYDEQIKNLNDRLRNKNEQLRNIST